MEQSPYDMTRLPPGWRRVHESSVSSTQDLARAAARRGEGSRLLFTCDFQREGRGRQGRSWVAPAGSSLMLTMLLHDEPLTAVEHTVLAGVTLCETIESLFGLAPVIKWPNDILLSDQKLAGVLAESSSDAPGYVAIGIGMNLIWKGERPAGVPAWATSLDEHTSSATDREVLLRRHVERIDDWLRLLARTDSSPLWDAWTRRLWRLGESVRVLVGEDIVEGHLLGGDPSGALLLERSDGEVMRLYAGDLALPGEPSGRMLRPSEQT